MSDPVRDWLARDPIRPSDAPTEAGWRAIERRIKRRRLLWPGLLAAAAIATILIGRAARPRDKSERLYVQLSSELEGGLRENGELQRPEILVIDSALAQARQALADDPTNEYVIRSIDQLKNQRLAALREACSFYC